MADKYYINKEDIQAISEAIKVLRSADFNAIHDHLEALSGINSGKNIEIGSLYTSVQQLQDTIIKRHTEITQDIGDGNRISAFNDYQEQLDEAITQMSKTITRMHHAGLKSGSRRKIDGTDLFDAVRTSMNTQFEMLSKPSSRGGSVENPNKQVKMFLEKGKSKIKDYIGKAVTNDSSNAAYRSTASKDIFDGTWEELYKAIGSGNFADLTKIAAATNGAKYAKIAQDIISDIESELGPNASDFKKDLAVTGMAKNLNVKQIIDFKTAFKRAATNGALNGGEKIASEVKKNVSGFLAQHLSQERYAEVMSQISHMFNFADGDDRSRDRAIMEAANAVDKMISDDVRNIFSQIPAEYGTGQKGGSQTKALLTDKTRKTAIKQATKMVNESVIDVGTHIGKSDTFARNDWFSGKTIQDRYNMLRKTSGKKADGAFKTKTYAQDSLRRIQTKAAQAGLSVMASISPDGTTMHLGFVPHSQRSAVIGKDGMINFDKTAGHVQIPMGRSDGSMRVNGASKADFFTSVLEGSELVDTTLSDLNFKKFADEVDRMNLGEMNERVLTKRLNRAHHKIYGTTTGLNTYVDSDEMLKGTTLGDNSAANLNKSSGYDSNPLIDSLKANPHVKRVTKGRDEVELNGLFHDLITHASSGTAEDYEAFIRSNPVLSRLYGSQGQAGPMRGIFTSLRQRLLPYGLTANDRRDDPYNAGIYSTSASHVLRPFLKEYGSGAGGRYGEQSIKTLAKTNRAKDIVGKTVGTLGLSKNHIYDGLAQQLGVSYRNEDMYNMLPVTDAELFEVYHELGGKGNAPSVFGGGISLRKDLYETLEANRAMPISVTPEELFSSQFVTDLLDDAGLSALREMRDGSDPLENVINQQRLARGYRIGGGYLRPGTQVKGISYSNGRYLIDTLETIKAAEGEKYLTGLQLRGTLSTGDIDADNIAYDDLIRHILKQKSEFSTLPDDQIDQLVSQISGFMSADDLSKTKYQAGNVESRLNYAVNGALNTLNFTEDEFNARLKVLQDKGGDLGNALSQYLQYSNGSVVTNAERSFTDILNDITKGDRSRIQQAEHMLFNPDWKTAGSLNNLLMKFVGEDSPLALGIKAGILQTSIGKADTAEYNDIATDEKYSRVKAGARERDIMRRTGRNIMAKPGIDAMQVKSYFDIVDEMYTPEHIELAEAEIERMKKVAASSIASGTKGDVQGDTYLSTTASGRAFVDPSAIEGAVRDITNLRADSDTSHYMMTADEYEASIFGHLEREREKIFGQGGFLDKGAIPLSAKLKGRVDMSEQLGEGFGINELFLSALPKQNDDGTYQLTQEQIAFERALRQSWNSTDGKNVQFVQDSIVELLKAQNASYMSKTGDLFKARNERVQTGAGFLQASAVNVEEGNRDPQKSNSIEVSENTARALLGNLDANTLKYLKQHIANKQWKGTGANGELTFDDIIEYYVNSGDYLVGELKRFPLKGDNTMSPTRIKINRDVADGTMRMHSGIAANLKADFDGDLPALTVAAYRKAYQSQQEFENAIAGGKAAVEALDPIVHAIGQYNTAKGNNKFKTFDDAATEYVSKLSSTSAGEREAIGSFSKKLKQSLGLHSSAFSGHNFVADALSLDSAEGQMRQMVLNSIYSSIEQDMLSNKKMEDIANNGNGLSVSENARIQSENLDKINKALYDKSTTIDGDEGMLNLWRQAGFIGSDGVANQFTLDAILKISDFFGTTGDTFLKDVLGIDVASAKIDAAANEDKWIISPEKIADIYKQHYGDGNFGEHSAKYRESIGKTVTDEAALRAAKYDARIYGVSEGDQEQAKKSAEVVGSLATALAGLIGDADGASEGIQRLSARLSRLLGLSHLGEIKSTGYNNHGKAVSVVANDIYGNKYGEDATEAMLSKGLDAAVKAKIKGEFDNPDIQNFQDMVKAQGGSWEYYRDKIQNARFGTMQHAGIEAVAKSMAYVNNSSKSDLINKYLSDKGFSLNSIAGLEKFLSATLVSGEGLPDGLDITDLQHVQGEVRKRYQAYTKSVAAYSETMDIMGFNQDTTRESIARVEDVTTRVVDSITARGERIVASEEKLGASIDGSNVHGIADIIVETSDGVMKTYDVKNTDHVSDGAVAQTGVYKAMNEADRADLQKDILSITNAQHLSDLSDVDLDAAIDLLRTSDENGYKTKYGDHTAGYLKTALKTSSSAASVIQVGSDESVTIFDNLAKGMEFLRLWSKALSGDLTDKDIENAKTAFGTKGALASVYQMLGLENPYSANKEKESYVSQKTIAKQQEDAMKVALKSHVAYDNAELNMTRALKAYEKSRASGNADAMAAAEQQLAGARSGAEIATRYKPQFIMYDNEGKAISTTDSNGKPVNLDTVRGQVQGGLLRYWNSEKQDWDTQKLESAQALQYQEKISAQWAKQQQAIGKVNAPIKTMGSLLGEVLGNIKQTTAYLMRTSVVYAIIGKVKQAFATLIQTTQALNKSYVDLRIASGQTDSQMKDSMKVYNQMAKEMGKTTQEVANAANDWLRAGYNAEESAKLIKNSMQLSTVGMIDSAKATEYLISTMKGWKLGVDDMEGVIDKMAELDRNEINNMAYHENGKSYPLNCWEILKLDKLQRNDEIYVSVICDESRKNYQDDTRLKPKCYYNRCSAAKLRIEESSTINRLVSGVGMKANVIPKRWASERAMI